MRSLYFGVIGIRPDMSIESIRRIGRGDRRTAGKISDVLLEASARDAKRKRHVAAGACIVGEGCNNACWTVADYLENARSEFALAQKQACRNSGFCRERAVVVSPLAKPDITATCVFAGRGAPTAMLTVESISAAPW